MLTRIEIDGFKSFTNFSMEFSPLTIIAGLNASGKSNLFDALHLLSLLAEKPLAEAFNEVQRGSNLELFTQYADGRYAEEMRFAVEMNSSVTHKINKTFGIVDGCQFRYELHIKRAVSDKRDFLVVAHELLAPSKINLDKVRLFVKKQLNDDGYYSEKLSGFPLVYLDSETGRVVINARRQSEVSEDWEWSLTHIRASFQDTKTSLNWTGEDNRFLSLDLIRNEIRTWKLLNLDPKKLPITSPTQSFGLPGTLNPAADNLAGVLWRLEKTDPYLLKRIAQRLTSLVPGIKEIVVKHDDYYNQYRVFVLTTNEQRFPLHLLSEGTLRMLALCTLAYDDQQHGVLGLEEPENGVHPGLLKRVAELLRDLSANEPPEEGQEPWPLRQVIVNTHSPGLIKACLEAAAGQEGGISKSGLSVWFSQLVGRSATENGKRVMRRVTDMLPVVLPEGGVLPDDSAKRVALAQLVSFLESANPDDLLGTLGLQEVADAL